jgi:Family of unknown function (DUF6236)
LQAPGLYFPYIHIRDEAWLKAAALYWPSVRRLVPAGYVKHDSPTARVFADAGVLQDEHPQYLIDNSHELLTGLREHADALVREFSVQRAFNEQRHRPDVPQVSVPFEHRALGWIHVTKFPARLVKHLIDLGLARSGRHIPLGQLGPDGLDLGWAASNRGPEWVGMHPALAGAYMTVLATDVSERAGFQPLTDQTDLRLATPNADVQAALRLLVGREVRADTDLAQADSTAEYVALALQYAYPAHLDDVSAQRILECRDKLADELATFRQYVASQREEWAQLAGIRVGLRRAEAFACHVQDTAEGPLRKLERGLSLIKLEPTRSLVLTTAFVPPAVAGLAVRNPVTGIAVGVAAAMGSAWWQVETIRNQARAASPVGYLLDIRDQLTPKTVTARIRRILRGTYGPPTRRRGPT